MIIVSLWVSIYMSKMKMYISLVHIYWYFKIYFECVFGHTHMHVRTHKCRLLCRCQIPVELALFGTGNHSAWMLGTKPRSCTIVLPVILPVPSTIFICCRISTYQLTCNLGTHASKVLTSYILVQT